MERCEVINYRTQHSLKAMAEKDGRYIDITRSGPWGNPFRIGRDGDRDEVLKKYRAYLLGSGDLLRDVREQLPGKILGCCCKPASCHGDILKEVVELQAVSSFVADATTAAEAATVISSINLVIGSPPYPYKGKRYESLKGSKLEINEWVDFMLEVTISCLTKCQCPVIWVVNNTVVKGCYIPAVEALQVRAFENDIIADRPVIWWKNAPPNRKDWFGNDWEFVICFKPKPKLDYWNWEAIGTPPKFKAGGRFRQRTATGARRLGSEYPQNKVTRPRDVIEATPISDVHRVLVGGGHMGSKLSTEKSEAPYPEKLIVPFIRALVPPGGAVFDPFSGSGTTAKVALQNGARTVVATDARQSQVEATLLRCKEAGVPLLIL